MNKRSAKKYVRSHILEAIDVVSGDDNKFKGEEKIKKLNELVALYDKIIPEINQQRKLDDSVSKKKYFNDIFAGLNKNLHSITGKKK